MPGSVLSIISCNPHNKLGSLAPFVWGKKRSFREVQRLARSGTVLWVKSEREPRPVFVTTALTGADSLSMLFYNPCLPTCLRVMAVLQ